MHRESCLVIGGGAFGLAAATELHDRGHAVRLIDRSLPPHPDASSTDISKAVRMDYGSDAFYAAFAREALAGWDAWNQEAGESLYRETGFLVFTAQAMAAESFELNGWQLLSSQGQPVERINARWLAEHVPFVSGGPEADGYLNRRGGWARSGAAMAFAARRLERRGVPIDSGIVETLLHQGDRVVGVRTADGREFRADVTVVATGAWTVVVLPWMDGALRANGQPVLHFRPADPAPFTGPVWGADIATTGWYGFPVTDDGIVKVGHHGSGVTFSPDRLRDGVQRSLPPGHEERCRAFLAQRIPELVRAPVVGERLCLYCDSFDGDFWIDRDPQRPGLVVAAGGSGHGFKFAPVIGPVIADVVEGLPNRWASRFAWREVRESTAEQARCRD